MMVQVVQQHKKIRVRV